MTVTAVGPFERVSRAGLRADNQGMTAVFDSPSALPALAHDRGAVTAVPTSVSTGTACLTLMDTECAAQVWEDLLFDGVGHEHGAGSLMLNQSAIGTHVEYDGDFPVIVHVSTDGHALGLDVNLDPYGHDLDSLRRPDGWVPGDDDEAHAALHRHHEDHGHDHHDGDDHGHTHEGEGAGRDHGHGPIADGWSDPVNVPLLSNRAVFGNPIGLPEADNVGGLLDLAWPTRGGALTASVYSERGVRRALSVVWVPAR